MVQIFVYISSRPVVLLLKQYKISLGRKYELYTTHTKWIESRGDWFTPIP